MSDHSKMIDRPLSPERGAPQQGTEPTSGSTSYHATATEEQETILTTVSGLDHGTPPEAHIERPAPHHEGGPRCPTSLIGRQYESATDEANPNDLESSTTSELMEMGVPREGANERMDHPVLVATPESPTNFELKDRPLQFFLFVTFVGIVALVVCIWIALSLDPDSSDPPGVRTKSDPSGPGFATVAPSTSPPLRATNYSTTAAPRPFQGWLKVGSDIVEQRAEKFGYSVSLSNLGNRLAIGSQTHYVVRVYEEREGQWIPIGLVDPAVTGPWKRFARNQAISGDGKRVAVRAPWWVNSSFGQVLVHEFQEGTEIWGLVGRPIVEKEGSWSSESVSLSHNGSIVAIGGTSVTDGGKRGRVKVYKFFSSNWIQLGEDLHDESEDTFRYYTGFPVSLSDDGFVVALGAWSNGTNFHYEGETSGQVLLYNYNVETSTWSQRGQRLEGERMDDAFGKAISLSTNGNIVAVGAPRNDGGGGDSKSYSCGQVRVFRYNEDTNQWIQLGSDVDGEWCGDKEGRRDRSGASVSLSGDGKTLAVGAYMNDDGGKDSGQCRIHRYNGSAWVQIGNDINGMEGDMYGHANSISLSSDGSRVAIGSKYANDRSGVVQVYRYTEATSSAPSLTIVPSSLTTGTPSTTRPSSAPSTNVTTSRNPSF